MRRLETYLAIVISGLGLACAAAEPVAAPNGRVCGPICDVAGVTLVLD